MRGFWSVRGISESKEQKGTGSAGACPRLSALIAFEDTPLTAKELAKVKKKIERQTGEGDRLLH